MVSVRILVEDDLVKSLGQESAAAAEEHLRFVLAAKLYELGEMSLGQAAKLCEMPKARFMLKLAEVGVSVIDLDENELADELRFG